MTTIDNTSNYCTLINVFTVDPEKHVKLFNVLMEATEEVMSKLPGYVSANIHISDDKKTITNYAQWETVQDFRNMLGNDEAKKHMAIAAEIAIDVKPVTYRRIWSHSVVHQGL